MTPSSSAIQVRFAGEEEPTTLALRPVGLMAVERRWGGKAFEDQPIEAMLLGCWVSAGKPGGDFDAWVETIDEIVADAAVPPVATPSEPSPPSP